MANNSPETYTKYKNWIYYFSRYDGWQDFIKQGKASLVLSNKKFPDFESFLDAEGGFNGAYQSSGDSWIREDSKNIEELDNGFYTTYLEQDLLDNTIMGFTEILDSIDMGGSFSKSKLVITDKTTGIFDFGLASLGLFSEVEFYSKDLAEKYPEEFPLEISGIVPSISVTRDRFDAYFYKSEVTGEIFKMTRQDEGTQRGLNDGYTLSDIPLNYKKFKTTQKKSYLTFKKDGGKARMVDLYVGVGGLGNMEGSGMLHRSLPMFLAAEYFESVGIRTRINASRMFSSSYSIDVKEQTTQSKKQQKLLNKSSSSENDITTLTYVIKDFGESLDFTKLAIAVADERTFRYNLWKYMPAIDRLKYGVNKTAHGRTVYGGAILLEASERYKNWYYDQIDNHNKDWVKIDKNLMLFGGVPEPIDKWVYTGLDKLSRTGVKVIDPTIQAVTKEFYRILDTVDFAYNDATKSAQRIYDREVESGIMNLTEYKSYVFKTLQEAYAVAEGGEYATPQIEIDEKEEKLDEKIDVINIFLQNLNNK
jgi:hypothetical protein